MADPGLDAERLRKVVRFTRRLALESDPDRVRAGVVQHVLEAITGDAALLVARTEDGELQVLAHFGTALEDMEAAVLSAASEAIGNSRTVLHQPDPARRATHPDTGRIAAAPMRLGEQRGALVLTRLFTARELVPTSVSSLHLLATVASETLRRSEADRNQKMWREHIAAWSQATSEAVVLLDRDQRVVHANTAGSRLLDPGGRSLTGRLLRDLDDGGKVLDVLSGGTTNRSRTLHLRSRTVSLRSRSHDVGTILLFREATAATSSKHRTRYSFDDIVTADPAVQQTLDAARQVARRDIPVLITGESGTGKEVLAQAIHSGSSRADQPFVPVNVAAIPSDLLESELFGYEGGAFTGARERGKPGAFELAGRGTLLLDEIGEMPKEMQAKLLRVLQERQVQRLGGTQPIPVRARVLATTHRDLERQVNDGAFRLDLYYRLRVASLELPPLRERPGDVPLLVDHFLERICDQLGRPPVELAPQVRDQLVHHPWRGNIRELYNLLLGMVSLLPESEPVLSEIPVFLSRPDLTPLAAPRSQPPDAARLAPSRAGRGPSHPLAEDDGRPQRVPTLEEVEKDAIVHALSQTEKNMSKTARLLGISRTTLYKKLEDYDLKE